VTYTILKQENEKSPRGFTVWTNDLDWCIHCDKIQHKLVFDEQTKTTKCTKCEHTETYADADWKILQTKRYVTTQYMPGKYHFNNNLTAEEIFQKYLRDLNHVDWSSWLMHDYLLAKMKQDQTTQNKLLETAKLVVNKMNYNATPWKKLFEKMDAKDPEMLYQVPQTIYEFAQKKISEAAPKEKLQTIMQNYVATLYSIYNYSRWKGDRTTCWITSEILKLCNLKNSSIDFTKYYNYDPILENFLDDILTKNKNREFNLKDTYIQWELNIANHYLTQQNAFAATWSAYKALTTKLELHTIWPPKPTQFDITTVKKVSQIVNDPELFRFYDLATDLNSIDPPKACYYAKYFIKKVQELLPKITTPEQEQTKTSTYIT